MFAFCRRVGYKCLITSRQRRISINHNQNRHDIAASLIDILVPGASTPQCNRGLMALAGVYGTGGI